MILQFKFKWGTILTHEDVEALRGLVRGGFEPRTTERGFESNYQVLIAEMDQVVEKLPHLMKFIRLENEPAAYQSFELIVQMFHQIMSRGRTVGPDDRAFNEKVNVHVPGLGLLLIDTVTVLECCCTTDLQTYLDEGWRIIAACPQPDQRRPDYVMGRQGPAPEKKSRY